MSSPDAGSIASDGFGGDRAQVLPLLLSAGLLSPADALDGGAELHPCGRSHLVFRLDLHGAPRLAIKLFGPRRGGTDGDPMRERAVHALVGSLPELAALLPQARPHAGPDWLLAQDWFAGSPTWIGDALIRGEGDGVEELDALAADFLPALSRLHRSTAQLRQSQPAHPAWTALQGPAPWVLRLFDGDGPAELWAYPNIAVALREAASRPRLLQGIRRARGAWRPRCLVHGDLKHDNLLRADDGRLALIDWEMARWGDPAWDLAGLLLRPLLSPSVERFDASAERAANSLLSHYLEGTRLPRAALAQRLLLYSGAWLLMSLIQAESVAASDAQARQRLLSLAEDCLARADHETASASTTKEDLDHAA